MEGLVTESRLASKRGGNDSEIPKATPIDEEGDVWKVEALLAKWKQGRRVLYLVQWQGFSENDNTWEKQNDIDADLVNAFDADYLQHISDSMHRDRTQREAVRVSLARRGV